MSSRVVPQSLTVMEAGFKVIPGREARWEFFQGSMIPMGMSQPGFSAVYGGVIHHSDWLYFGVRFASQNEMEAWHQHPAHLAVQKSAYENFWTAVYIRKWRQPVAGEGFGDRIMAETRLAMAAPLDTGGLAAATAALSGLAARGASRFETLHGDFEPQPYLLIGPLAIAPAPAEGTLYTLITHWTSIADVAAWQASGDYRALAALGTATTECFIPFVETGTRDRLDAERLQRDWVLQGHDFQR